MEKCKVFDELDPEKLEEKINIWLRGQSTKIEITSRLFATAGERAPRQRLLVIIFYKEI